MNIQWANFFFNIDLLQHQQSFRKIMPVLQAADRILVFKANSSVGVVAFGYGIGFKMPTCR